MHPVYPPDTFRPHTSRSCATTVVRANLTLRGSTEQHARTAAFERLCRQQCLFLEHQTVSVKSFAEFNHSNVATLCGEPLLTFGRYRATN